MPGPTVRMTDEEFLAYCYTTATQTTHCNMVSVTLIRLAELAGDTEALALLKKQSVHTSTGCHEQVLAWVAQARAKIAKTESDSWHGMHKS